MAVFLWVFGGTKGFSGTVKPDSYQSTFINDYLKPIFHCDAKILAGYYLGCCVGQYSQRESFALGIPTCWNLKMLKFALPPMPNLKFALPPMRTPNASQWNIGCVGTPGVGTHVGHVHFILFVSISFALGSQCKRGFQWNMGLRLPLTIKKNS